MTAVETTPPATPPTESPLTQLAVHVESDTDAPSRDAVLEFECDWDVGIGGSVWTSGEILTSYLASQQPKYRALFRDKVVVELGSGTGFVGLLTAVCFAPARVLISDLATHVECMQKNTSRNATQYSPGVDVRAVELSWGDKDHEDALLQSLGPHGKVDIILGTDVAYLRELYEPLLHTLSRLASDGTLVLLGMNRTDTGMDFFRRLVDEGFEYYKIDDRFLPRDYRGKDFGLFEVTRVRPYAPIIVASPSS